MSECQFGKDNPSQLAYLDKIGTLKWKSEPQLFESTKCFSARPVVAVNQMFLSEPSLIRYPCNDSASIGFRHPIIEERAN